MLSHRQRHKRSDKSKAKRGAKHGEWSDCRIVPKKDGESRLTAGRWQPGVGWGRRQTREEGKSQKDRRAKSGRRKVP